MTLTKPRRRFGYPPARGLRLIDRATVEHLVFAYGGEPLSVLKMIFGPGAVWTELAGAQATVTIIDSESDDALAEWVDVVLINAAAALGVSSVADLTVGLSDLHHDPSSGRSWRLIAIAG